MINAVITTSEGNNIQATIVNGAPPAKISGFEIKFKGNGNLNSLAIEPGDCCSGLVTDQLYVRYAIYAGGDLNDPNSWPLEKRLGQFNPQQLYL